MILVDANLLLYAYNPSDPNHGRAREWVERTFSGAEPVRLAWVTILAFIRIGTNPRAFPNPLSIADAVSTVGEWLAQHAVDVLQPTERHWEILSELLPKAQARADLVTDAHLAALAIEHGAALCSTDRDFARFPKLRFENPLA